MPTPQTDHIKKLVQSKEFKKYTKQTVDDFKDHPEQFTELSPTPQQEPDFKKLAKVIADHVYNINLQTNTTELDLVATEIEYRINKLLTAAHTRWKEQVRKEIEELRKINFAEGFSKVDEVFLAVDAILGEAKKIPSLQEEHDD